MIQRALFTLRVISAVLRRLCELAARDRGRAGLAAPVTGGAAVANVAVLEVQAQVAAPAVVTVGAWKVTRTPVANPGRSLDAAPGWSELPSWLGTPELAPDYTDHAWPAADCLEAVVHWMLTEHPDAWYFCGIGRIERTAKGLIEARAACHAGRLSELVS